MKRKMKAVLLTLILIYIMSSMQRPGISASINRSDIQTNVTENNRISIINDVLNSNTVKIASNHNFSLFADMESGHFCLVNEKSGAHWYSVPPDIESDTISKAATKMLLSSELSIECVYLPEVTTTLNTKKVNSKVACLNNGNVSVKKINNGIRVEYDFAEYAIIIPVNYFLTENGLSAEIDIEKIEEKSGYILTSVNLLPSFGAGGVNDSGYLFVPDGSGAIINFNNGKDVKEVYLKNVYGTEQAEEKDIAVGREESVYMPVFGIYKNGHTLFGIITEGDANASITALNSNKDSGYTTVSSILELKKLTHKTMFSDTASRRNVSGIAELHSMKGVYRIEYFADFEYGGGYTAMAQRYREYLENNQELKKQQCEIGINLSVYGIIQMQKQFLGIPYKKDFALTTFSEAEKIIKDFKGAVSSVDFYGWQKGGELNIKPMKYISVSSAIGGEKAYWELKDSLGNNVTLNLAFNPLLYKKGSSKYSVKDLFNTSVLTGIYLRSVYTVNKDIDEFYYINPYYFSNVSDKYLSYFNKEKIKNITVSGMLTENYSSYYKNRNFLREDYPEEAVATLKKYTNDEIKITSVGANAYSFKYLSRIVSAPMSSGGNIIFDYDIPFYQMVLRGYLPLYSAPIYQYGDSRTAFLCAVESGMGINYNVIYDGSDKIVGTEYENLYDSNYKKWINVALKDYNDYKEILEKIKGCAIVGHQYISDEFVKTEYDNGISVYVNYSNVDKTSNNITVKAQNYYITEE